MYGYQIEDIGQTAGLATKFYEDNTRIQHMYIIYFPYHPIRLKYWSKDIHKNAEINKIEWQKKHDINRYK